MRFLFTKNHTLKITFSVSKYASRTFGELVKKLRLERKLPQKELAEKIGVNEMSVVGWEKNLREPRGRNALELARFFGTQGELMFEMLSKSQR
jgi:DNA-binding XRE family transcriptional regulator